MLRTSAPPPSAPSEMPRTPGAVRGAKHDSSRPVAEEDARGPVREVDVLGECLGTDDEDGVRATRLDQRRLRLCSA